MKLNNLNIPTYKKGHKMTMEYAYAVIDTNQSPDQRTRPWSCHVTLSAAKKAADRLTTTPNDRWAVIEWGSSATAALRPAPSHPDAVYWGRPKGQRK